MAAPSAVCSCECTCSRTTTAAIRSRRSNRRSAFGASAVLAGTAAVAVVALLGIGPSPSGVVAAAASSSSSGSSNKWGDSGFAGPRANFLETVLEGGNVANQKSCKPTGLIQDACCDYQTVEQVNDDLAAKLDEIIQLPFFRYQKVNLFPECAFWQEDGSCMNRACAVQETDEADIPEAWRSSSLGQVKEAAQFPTSLQGTLFKDADFCILDEDLPTSDSVYVDLYENPERFTGYAGASANRVWKAIYEENCFGVVPYYTPSRGVESGGSGYVGTSLINDKKQNVRSLMGNLGLAAPRDTQDEEQCLEKRVYYRLISGLHASISIHICAEYLDQTTGEWKPNLACFITRIAEHPERLQNVYFDYVMMLRALNKAAKFLRGYDYHTGDAEVDAKTKSLVNSMLDRAESCQATFDETSMFSGPGAITLKEEFKSHFRNVSRIMDCVGCDKCRLWGKTQVTGVATGLKLLFSCDDATSPSFDNKFELGRSEIVAFIWTLHRFSESLAAVEKFREMWAQRDRIDEEEKQQEVAEQRLTKVEEDSTDTAGNADSYAPEDTPLPRLPLDDFPVDVKQSPTDPVAPASDATSESEHPHKHQGQQESVGSADVPAVRAAPSTTDSLADANESEIPEDSPDNRSEDYAASSPSSSIRSRRAFNDTSTFPTTAVGPRISGILTKLYAACVSSIAACFALVERGVSFLASTLAGEKTEL